MGLHFVSASKALIGPLLGALVGAAALAACQTAPAPRVDPCPGALTCPNLGCCPLGWPFSCDGKCYQAASSCVSSYVTCSGFSSSGAGGSSGTYQPATCGQSCQDYLSGLGLDATVWLTYNENVAGKPSGNVDQTAACPLGGTVHITGTTSVASDGTNTLHLVFDLAACANSAASYSLTFTGSVVVDGTMNSTGASKFTYVTFTTHGMVMSGALKYLDDPAIAETCDVAVTQQDSGGSSSLDGQVCGREFSSATALGGGAGGGGTGSGGTGSGGTGSGGTGSGGTGSGGTSAAGGSSGGACDCYCGWPANTRCTKSTDCPSDTSVPGTSVPGACGKPVDCAACTPP